MFSQAHLHVLSLPNAFVFYDSEILDFFALFSFFSVSNIRLPENGIYKYYESIYYHRKRYIFILKEFFPLEFKQKNVPKLLSREQG